MTDWGSKAAISVVGGLAVFAVLLIPLLITQYRRYGRLSPRRIAATSLGCVYAVALAAYTLLPLPDSRNNCGPFGDVVIQLTPFEFLTYISNAAVGNTLFGVLISAATLQVVLNVALFVPFGLFVRGVAGRRLLTTTLLGLAVSLLIEITQATRLWGLFDCRYRVADVDDLILNTTGALVGALIAPRLRGLLPRPERLALSRLRPRPVNLVRRWLGMIIDLGALVGLAGLLTLAAATINQLLGIELSGTAVRLTGLPSLIAGVIVVLLPAASGSGASIGQRAVWLRPSWPGRPERGAPFGRRLLRAGVAGGTLTLGIAVSLSSDPASRLQWVAALLALPAVASPVVAILTPGRRGLSFLLARADLEDAR